MKERVRILEIQPHELRRGIELIVESDLPDLQKSKSKRRAQWLYSLAMTAARRRVIVKLNEYRNEKLKRIDYVKEKHNSVVLARNLNAVDKVKPDDPFEAHHIISGNHKHARAARAILAQYNIRIDDPDNGVWLPNFKKNVPHPCFPDAPAHRTVHTAHYYINITTLLRSISSSENKATEEEVRAVLRKIGERLQAGRFAYLECQDIDVNKW